MHENKRRFLLLVSLSSPRSLVTPDPSNGKESGLTWGADKGIHTPFFKQSPRPTPFLTLNLVARSIETNDYTRLVGLQKTYAPVATTLMLTSVIKVSLLRLELYGLNK